MLYALGTPVFIVDCARRPYAGKIALRQVMESLDGGIIRSKVSYGVVADDTGAHGESANWIKEKDIGGPLELGFGVYWTKMEANEAIHKTKASSHE